jgi:hypothetical protein
MKFSSETINILKNFSNINMSLVIPKGSRIVTAPKNVLSVQAIAVVAEVFPVDVIIYDLPQFLGVLGIMPNSDVDYHATSMTITSGDNSIEYHYADPSVVKAAPDKTIKHDHEHLEFVLNETDLVAIHRAASAFSSPIVYIASESGEASIGVGDPAIPSSNTYKHKIGPCTSDFEYHVSVNNIQLLSDTYTVSVLKRGTSGFVRFRAEKYNLIYNVAIENTSKV